MNKTLYTSITVVSVVLGLMVALQFRTAGRVDSGVPMDRVQILTTESKQLDKEYATLLMEANDLESKLEKAGKGASEASQAVYDEVTKARQIAGLTQLQGSGVEVTLAPLKRDGQEQAENLFTVRDEDLLRVVNELRAAGAEALAINGQRIVTTSEIRLAGSFIDVNLTRITPPYSVLAIGAPDQLESALIIKGGLVDTMQDWGVSVKVARKESLTIPAYAHRVHFEYATPIKEES